MSGDMQPYVVRQGDYLAKLAFVHGFDAEEVWNDAKNEEIRGRRPDHNILAPGDIVYLPVKKKEGLPIVKGTTNKYSARVPKVDVNLVFKNADGTPLSEEPYEIRGAPPASDPLATDADGHLTIQVPVTVREVCIVFPERHFSYTARIGDLDPSNEMSGVAQRLRNLGHLARDASSPEMAADDVRAAIAAFQAETGASSTGALDAETQSALFEIHGI